MEAALQAARTPRQSAQKQPMWATQVGSNTASFGNVTVSQTSSPANYYNVADLK